MVTTAAFGFSEAMQIVASGGKVRRATWPKTTSVFFADEELCIAGRVPVAVEADPPCLDPVYMEMSMVYHPKECPLDVAATDWIQED